MQRRRLFFQLGFFALFLLAPALNLLRFDLTDAQFWTARFGMQFLRDQLEKYTLDVAYRLNERFTLTGLWRYDTIESQFYEQVYGLRQTFRNL